MTDAGPMVICRTDPNTMYIMLPKHAPYSPNWNNGNGRVYETERWARGTKCVFQPLTAPKKPSTNNADSPAFSAHNRHRFSISLNVALGRVLV